ncbi:MAG: riboflavin synthase [Candidatus Paceibacteria bacterium]|jgi:riboflavin synthase
MVSKSRNLAISRYQIYDRSMFTGIIRATAQVLSSTKKDDLLQMTFEKPNGWTIGIGDSIATNGVCLTVAEVNSASYMTELMQETLDKSIFGISTPSRVNLEQSLMPTQLLDGHLVQGHVDTTGSISERLDHNGSSIITVTILNMDPTLVIPKGSITIDGMSLTIIDISDNSISVSLVEYTLDHTIAGHDWQIGQTVNIEYDMMGKYITNYMKHNQK